MNENTGMAISMDGWIDRLMGCSSMDPLIADLDVSHPPLISCWSALLLAHIISPLNSPALRSIWNSHAPRHCAEVY